MYRKGGRYSFEKGGSEMEDISEKNGKSLEIGVKGSEKDEKCLQN